MGLTGKKDNVKVTEKGQSEFAVPENSVQELFTKERIFTYIWIIFFPPFGLYRVWNGKSTFRRSEKWVWTMVVIVYLIYFVKLIIAG